MKNPYGSHVEILGPYFLLWILGIAAQVASHEGLSSMS